MWYIIHTRSSILEIYQQILCGGFSHSALKQPFGFWEHQRRVLFALFTKYYCFTSPKFGHKEIGGRYLWFYLHSPTFQSDPHSLLHGLKYNCKGVSIIFIIIVFIQTWYSSTPLFDSRFWGNNGQELICDDSLCVVCSIKSVHPPLPFFFCPWHDGDDLRKPQFAKLIRVFLISPMLKMME